MAEKILKVIIISIAYLASILFRSFSYRINISKEIIPITLLIITWILSISYGSIPEAGVDDAKNALNYIILYFIAPLFITFFTFFLCEVDLYQLIRRFFGLVFC